MPEIPFTLEGFLDALEKRLERKGHAVIVVGDWGGDFTHVPIPMAVSRRKKIDPGGRLWSIVLASSGQPAVM